MLGVDNCPLGVAEHVNSKVDGTSTVAGRGDGCCMCAWYRTAALIQKTECSCKSCHLCCWVSAAGDHLQLPPTVLSDAAAKAGLACTLFERLQHSLGEAACSMLTVQYRMHSHIMDWSSQELYEVGGAVPWASGQSVPWASTCDGPVCAMGQYV